MAEIPISPKIEPEEASVYLRSARQYMEEDLHEQAILMLKAALVLEPNNTEILLTLAGAYFAIEKYDDAQPLMQLAHQLDPSAPNPIMGLGNIYVNTGRWDAAIEQIGTLYPLHKAKALELFNNVFVSFNSLLFDGLLEISRKHAEQGKKNNHPSANDQPL